MTWRRALAFRVDGDPVGAARPRVTVRGSFASAYMPKAHTAAEARIADAARVAFRDLAGSQRTPFDEPVAVQIRAVHGRPAALVPRPRSRKAIPLGRMWRTTKPDADNIAKIVLDGLVKAGVMVDDTRVVRLTVTKEYVAIEPAEGPHVHVEVYTEADASLEE